MTSISFFVAVAVWFSFPFCARGDNSRNASVIESTSSLKDILRGHELSFAEPFPSGAFHPPMRAVVDASQQYQLSFEVLFTGIVTFGYWGSIIQLTASNRDGLQNGDRIPGIWQHMDGTTKLYVRTGTSFHGDLGCTTSELPLNQWISVFVTVSNGNLDVTLSNNIKGCSTALPGTLFPSTKNVGVFIGDTFGVRGYAPAKMKIRNVFYLTRH